MEQSYKKWNKWKFHSHVDYIFPVSREYLKNNNLGLEDSSREAVKSLFSFYYLSHLGQNLGQGWFQFPPLFWSPTHIQPCVHSPQPASEFLLSLRCLKGTFLPSPPCLWLPLLWLFSATFSGLTWSLGPLPTPTPAGDQALLGQRRPLHSHHSKSLDFCTLLPTWLLLLNFLHFSLTLRQVPNLS